MKICQNKVRSENMSTLIALVCTLLILTTYVVNDDVQCIKRAEVRKFDAYMFMNNVSVIKIH